MSVSRRSQQGAALVVGLLLLVIITLLAIAGMNTASTELIMAGNEQFREAGIEREIVNLRDVSPNGAPITREAAFGANARSSTTITYRGEGGAQGMSSSFVAFHYDVTSVGTSSRNATVTQVQGAYYTNQMGTDGTMLPLPGTTGAITVD
jgi:type IV pilus assembly protein PilX